MKILLINGSPRHNGNSDAIMEEISAYAMSREIETIYIILRDKKINQCNGCDTCHKEKNKCCHRDDFSTEIFSQLLETDAILIITPVYQGSVTGIMKTFMDRCEVFRKGRLLKDKLCGGVAIGGYIGGGQELTLMQIQHFSHICSMRYIASWGKIRSHFGGYCVAFEKNDIKDDSEGIDSCKNVIDEMINFFNFKKITKNNMNNSLEELQKKQYELLKGIEHPKLGNTVGLFEEVGELAKEVMEIEFYDEDKTKELSDECADVLFSLFSLCDSYNISLEESYLKKVESIKEKVPSWKEKYGGILKKKRGIMD